MNIQSIIITNIIGIVLLIFLLFSDRLAFSRKVMKLDDRLFYAMVFLSMSTCLVEMISFIVDGCQGEGFIVVNYFTNIYLYLATVIIPIVWVAYVEYKLYPNLTKLKKNIVRFSIPGFILCVLVIATMHSGLFFTITPLNVYSRGKFAVVLMIYGLLELGHSVAAVFKNQRRKQLAIFFPIWIFVVPIVIAAVIQLIFYGVSVFWCSVAIGIIAVHMSLQNENSYVDELTGLLNRKYIVRAVKSYEGKRNKICTGIMIDIDDFKSINDTYGHSVGDDAIRTAAHIISEAEDERTISIRYAGDEFIMLKNSDEVADVDELMERVRASLEEYNKRNIKPYKLSFSMGSSVYYEGPNGMDIFLKTMDDNMYKEKKTKKISSR